MTNSVKTDIVQSLRVISYFWLQEENYQCSYSIIQLLNELKLDFKQKKILEELEHDFKVMSTGKYTLKDYQNIKIPKNFCDTEERKLLWISGVSIMNLFGSANFELAYSNLLEMSANWEELYVFVINNLKKQPFLNLVTEWLFTHFLMVQDLLGDEMEMLGYKVIKLKEE